MKKILLITLFSLFAFAGANAQIVKFKTVDDGGSGPYKAIAASEETLPDFTVYRPEDLEKIDDPLPIIIFGNGGCANSSLGHERFLTDLASYGYIVVAIGPFQESREPRPAQGAPAGAGAPRPQGAPAGAGAPRPQGAPAGPGGQGAPAMMVSSESYMMFKALDWIVNQAQNSRTAYYGKVNVDQVAAMGMSCGGCQAIYLSCDPRVTTLVVLNSGMGTMTLANATPRNVKAIHCPTVYITGGEADIAYKNAEVDYNTLTDVPVAWMNLPVGHGGTYAQEFGGDFARMARAWLDYTMKGRTENERIFKQLDLTGFDGWTAQSKNFK